MNSETQSRIARHSASLAHVKAAGWGKGLFTLIRITAMAFRHPWQSGFAIGDRCLRPAMVGVAKAEG